MLFEHALLLIGIPLVLIILGVIKNYSAMVIAGGIGLLVVGVLVLANPVIVHYEVNFTAEVSHVWNCSTTESYCFGTPEPKTCYWYNSTQCAAIPGCEWIGNNCYGTPTWSCTQLFNYGGEEKCIETKGCYMSDLVNPQTCDSYDTTYTYEGVELPENDNLILGVLLAFVGLLALAAGAVGLKG